MERIKKAVLSITVILCLFPSLIFSASDYRLGAGDVIVLNIFAGGKVQNECTLTISASGMVAVPFLGEVDASGLTKDKFSKKIRELLARDYFIDPVVNISIKEYRSQKAYVLGEVKKPGFYEIKGEMTVLSLISEAEGINALRAANFALLLRGQAGEMKDRPIEQLLEKNKGERIDLKRLLRGDPGANLKVFNGDLLYIPAKEGESISFSKIYVMGRVRNPKDYDFQEGLTALNACILAGGFDPFAAPSRTSIMRKKGEKEEIIGVNLEKVRDGKEPDVLLKPGDRIYIPEKRF